MPPALSNVINCVFYILALNSRSISVFKTLKIFYFVTKYTEFTKAFVTTQEQELNRILSCGLESVWTLQRRDNTLASSGNRATIRRTLQSVRSRVTTPTALCRRSSAESTIGDICFVLVVVLMCLCVCFRWTVGMSGSRWWTTSACQNTAPIAVWGWSRYTSGKNCSYYPRESRAWSSKDRAWGSESYATVRSKIAAHQVFIQRWLLFEALGVIPLFCVHALHEFSK
jgi:hypothetical protein